MRPKSIVLLLLALGCGLVASIGISQVMENRGQATVSELEPIVVAAVDINQGAKLVPEVFKMEEWPKNKVPDGAITNMADLEGKHLRGNIYKGEPMLRGKLAAPGDEGASPHIPAGYRVCAVRVDAASASGSLIRPGDRVDVLVYLTQNASMGIRETGTHTVLQDISVFAVDTTFVGQEGDNQTQTSIKTVSLLVTPSQAETVTLANEMGSIKLVLRSNDDSEQTQVTGKSVQQLISNSTDSTNRQAERPKPSAAMDLLEFLKSHKPEALAPTMAQPAAAPQWKMVVMRGGDVRQIEIPTDGSLPNDPGADKSTETAPDAGSAGVQTPATDVNDDPAPEPTSDELQDESKEESKPGLGSNDATESDNGLVEGGN